MDSQEALAAALTTRRSAIEAAARALGLDPRSAPVIPLIDERAPAGDNGDGAGVGVVEASRCGSHDQGVAAALPGALVAAAPLLAATLADGGAAEAAIPGFVAATAADPTDPVPWASLGLLRSAVGDPVGALEAFGTGATAAAALGVGPWAAHLALAALGVASAAGTPELADPVLRAVAAAVPSSPELRLALARLGVPGQVEVALMLDAGLVLDAAALDVADLDAAAAAALATTGGAGSNGYARTLLAWAGESLAQGGYDRPPLPDAGVALAADGGQIRPSASLAVAAASEVAARRALLQLVTPTEPEPSVPAAPVVPRRRRVDLPDPTILGRDGAERALAEREATEDRRFAAATSMYERQVDARKALIDAHRAWVGAGHVPGALPELRAAITDGLAELQAQAAAVIRPAPLPLA